MEKVTEDTYLGSVISDSCDNSKKLEKAIDKGIGISSVIMAMLQELSLGNYYLEIATLLRETLFINGFLWNIETWYGIKENDLNELEKIDRMLIKRILAVPSSTPTALLYLELGLVPLRYIIQARRLTFLRYILTRKDDDLLLKFFKAQDREPSKDDWSATVKKDLEDFEIDETFEDITQYSKTSWQNKVRQSMKAKAFEDLLESQTELSKGSNLNYGDLKMRSYLKSNHINIKQAKLIFKIRTRMMNVKTNYKQNYNDLSCPCCKLELATQEHMAMTCEKLSFKISQKEYLSFFGQNEDDMAKVVKKFETNEQDRNNILDI